MSPACSLCGHREKHVVPLAVWSSSATTEAKHRPEFQAGSGAMCVSLEAERQGENEGRAPWRARFPPEPAAVVSAQEASGSGERGVVAPAAFAATITGEKPAEGSLPSNPQTNCVCANVAHFGARSPAMGDLGTFFGLGKGQVATFTSENARFTETGTLCQYNNCLDAIHAIPSADL